MDESKRVRNLKKRLIKELPFFPNNKDTLTLLESKRLNELLIYYLHWKTRLVPTRQRKVQIAPDVTSDRRWKLLKKDIKALLDKIRSEKDVLPYLSMKAHKYGYTPIHRKENGEFDSWEDKDQILNTTGFHHFHLNMNILNTGLSERTHDVLFACITREHFHAIGIFDHSVFEAIDNDGSVNEERSRMWKLQEKHTTLGMKPGTTYMSPIIATSGHPLNVVKMAGYYSSIILEHDAKLDNREFVNNLYGQSEIPSPSKYNFEWHINNLDLCIYDKKTDVLFNIHLGHI